MSRASVSQAPTSRQKNNPIIRSPAVMVDLTAHVVDLTSDNEDNSTSALSRKPSKLHDRIQAQVPLPDNVHEPKRKSLSYSTSASSLYAPQPTHAAAPVKRYSTTPIPLPSSDPVPKDRSIFSFPRIPSFLRAVRPLQRGATMDGSGQTSKPENDRYGTEERQPKRRKLDTLSAKRPDSFTVPDDSTNTLGDGKLGAKNTGLNEGSLPRANLQEATNGSNARIKDFVSPSKSNRDIGRGTKTSNFQTFNDTNARELHIKGTAKWDDKGLGFYAPGSEEPESLEEEDGSLLKAFEARSFPLRKERRTSDLQVAQRVLTPPQTEEDEELIESTTEVTSSPFTHEKGLAKAKELSRAAVARLEQGQYRTPSDSRRGTSVHAPPIVPQADGEDVRSEGSTATVMEAATPLISDSLKAQPRGPTQSREPGGSKYTQEEDDLIIYLKEVRQMSWTQIGQYFPSRTKHTVQSRYSRVLSNRNKNVPSRLTTASAPPNACRRHSSVVDVEVTMPDAPTESTQPLSEPITSATIASTRSRRSVGTVNYDVRRRVRALRVAEDSMDEDSLPEHLHSVSLGARSADISEEPREQPIPSATLLPNTPLKLRFEGEEAQLGVAISAPRRERQDSHHYPYLDYSARRLLRDDVEEAEWELISGRRFQGSIVHVDFQQQELELIERVAMRALSVDHVPGSNSVLKRIQRLLKGSRENQMMRISYEVRKRLRTRNSESVDAFLRDASEGLVNFRAHIERLGAVRQDRSFSTAATLSTSSLIRHRELGSQSRRGWRAASTQLSYQTRNQLYDTLGPALSFTGASSDISSVAWAPDGLRFAAGSYCVTDDDSMQYNRPNNLLFGDTVRKTLLELPDHHIERKMTPRGANSTQAMHVTQDPRLFTTVSMVNFSPDGQYMFSAGYDKQVRVWINSPDGSAPRVGIELGHKAPVDLLAINCHGIVATGTQKSEKNAIKVVCIVDLDNDIFVRQSYTSQKAIERAELNIRPNALRFEPNHGRMLLAGFGANKREDRPDVGGEICLWDVETAKPLHVHGNTRNVFDVAFNQRQVRAPSFAVGCVAGANVNRGMRSIVRLYDPRAKRKYGMIMELECPALDMNDVVYCPHDDLYLAAGCTDGSTYIWDVRNPDSFLYKLSHGKPLQPLPDYQASEITDTGIRFCAWGDSATRLYTGSSDGVVKVWDVARSREDSFIKDLVSFDSGIMAGAFSPDKTSLLLGEVNGSINVLQVGREDCSVRDMEPLRHIAAPGPGRDDEDTSSSSLVEPPARDSGSSLAHQLLHEQQMQIVPFGGLPIKQAVQGPAYQGPFDSSPDAPLLREQARQFQHNFLSITEPQCQIPTCSDSTTKITGEEAGDSGRSADRVPDELRKQWKNIGSSMSVVPGKTKCSECGRSARPLDSTARPDEVPLCERCSFECFRCDGYSRIHSETQTLICENCGRRWDIGALGYECVKHAGNGLDFRDVPRLSIDRDERGASLVSFGDEVNALTDYYQTLWIDRPSSPLL